MTSRYANIVVVDIERFGTRNNLLQKHMRQRLLGSMRDCMEGVLERGDQLLGVIDRGDGYAFLIDPSVSKVDLMSRFLVMLDIDLRRLADLSSKESTIRLRLSFHAGEISQDETGFSGEALNQACRIVDADPLRGVLARISEEMCLAVALSDDWHRSVCGQGWMNGAGYRAAIVELKEMSTVVHIGVPGIPASSLPPEPFEGGGPPPAGARPSPGPRKPAPAAFPAGTTFSGRTQIVNGNINAGRDVVQGDAHNWGVGPT